MIKKIYNSFVKKIEGVSLVELMVTIVLIGIIAAVTARMLVTGAGAFNSVSSRNKVLHSNRISLEMLMKDLRSIKSKDHILSASSNQLTFINIHDEQINYSFSNGTLYRNSNMNVEGLSTFELTYYDDDGNVISSPVSTLTDIWDINVSVDATVEGQPFHLNSRMHPRNIY
jgi:prepilin-type N-terminal cleavage/methylation domain-containing protein